MKRVAHPSLVLALGLLALLAHATACRSLPATDRASPPRSTAATAIDAGASAAEPAPGPAPAPTVETALAWGTRPPKDGILFPVVDGMCIHGEARPLANAVVFTYGTSRGAYSRGGQTTTVGFGDRGLPEQGGFGFGAAFGYGGITAIGGRYPDHLWAIIDVSTRMVAATDLRLGSAKGDDWKIAAAGGDPTASGDGATPTRTFAPPLTLEDGSVLIPERITAPGPEPHAESYAFRAIDANGALLDKARVPGADMARLAFEPYSRQTSLALVALATGEIVGVRQRRPQVVRWSPVKAVSDLALPEAPGPLWIAAGPKRAVVESDLKLFVYDGDKVEPAKVTPRLTKGFRWTVGDDDTLYVALPTKTLLVERPGGTVTEEPMPAFGTLHARGAGAAVWLISDGGKALHRRTAKGWEPVPLPAPPFGNALRGPLTIEGLTFAAGDDVFVNAHRIEKGWGWRDPEPYRVIYRTKRPEQVLRCQDVRLDSTGHGVYPWPPAADDACTTPFVVVLRDDAKVPPKSYPAVVAKLRGKSEFGSSLALVSFEGRGSQNLGIPMNDVETARKLAVYLSKALDYRTDVVCGRPTPTRELTLDVASGNVVAATGR